jgi:hypothetical protein
MHAMAILQPLSVPEPALETCAPGAIAHNRHKGAVALDWHDCLP